MNGLISVVIPVYNVEVYLKRCIDSILNQTYKNIQVILVNDGSKDNSGLICNQYAQKDSRITVIHQENKGVSSARNAGIKASKGDYITFVDADDELVENAFDITVEYLEKHQADVVSYGWEIIDEGTQEVTEQYDDFQVLDNNEYIIEKILENYSAFGGGYPWNKIWRTSVFDQVPAFDESMWYFEDLDWVVKMMLCINKMVVCPECLYKYYYRESSATNSAEKAQGREVSYHLAIESIINQLSAKPDLQKRFANKYYPEIINGIIGAKRNSYSDLKNMLAKRMVKLKKDIFSSLRLQMKVRFVFVYLLYKLHLL